MPSYTYNEANKVLTIDTPIVTRAQLLLICKEIDADTPADETTSFVESAHSVVCSVLDGYGIPVALLAQIEKYLSAHFAALSYPTVQREGLGPMTTSYAVKVGATGLETSRYGQMAISLDPSGQLKRYSDGEGQREPTMHSIGNGVADPQALYGEV